MQLNQATDYAFRAVLHLAELPPNTVINSHSLAEAESIPLRFLLKIMHSLTQAGLVKSYRGTEGGFVLAKSLAEISLLDVITAMEGPIAIHRCLAEREACNKQCSHDCPIHDNLHQLQDELTAGLRRATLAFLLEKKRSGKARYGTKRLDIPTSLI